MVYYITLLSYGDNLISLSLIEKVKHNNNLVIIGTGLTEMIANYIPNLKIKIIKIFEGIPSFYDLRKKGLRLSLADGLHFYHEVSSKLCSDDIMIFEKKDFRNKLIRFDKKNTIYEPFKGNSIYRDRKNVIENIFDEKIELKDCLKPSRMPKSITINPKSRIAEKTISHDILKHIISYLNSIHATICLIDPDGSYEAFSDSVNAYHKQTKFDEAIELLKQSQLYIGADSLLIHFAYYLDVPFLLLFNKENLYFAPPGAELCKNYIVMDSISSERLLYNDLELFFNSI